MHIHLLKYKRNVQNEFNARFCTVKELIASFCTNFYFAKLGGGCVALNEDPSKVGHAFSRQEMAGF